MPFDCAGLFENPFISYNSHKHKLLLAEYYKYFLIFYLFSHNFHIFLFVYFLDQLEVKKKFNVSYI